MAATTPVAVRIDVEQLTLLEKIGSTMVPKPLNRSEMINVAIAEYVRNHAGGKPAAGKNKSQRSK